VIPAPGIKTWPGAYLSHLMGDPLQDFFRRHQGTAMLILSLICVYRLAESVLNIMNPFYLDLGFSLTEIAEVRKLFGVLATLIGVSAGGVAITRFGLLPSLVVGAFAQPLSHVGFIWLATQGHHMSALFVAIGLDNIASGFAGTCLIAYMSSLTSAGFTASQYALFSSLYSLFGKIIASQSGRIVESSAQSAESGGAFSALNGMFAGLPADAYTRSSEIGVSPASLGAGYVVFFIYSALIGIAGIILAIAIAARTKPQPAEAPAPAT
jgi:PAT family beta-lactamase induction signal transducer AmpG